MGREDTYVYIVGTGAGGVWESRAKKALFCRSLTVENHLLLYQEMRPLGMVVATACGDRYRCAQAICVEHRWNTGRIPSLERKAEELLQWPSSDALCH